ncbi:peptidoglycan DD-metalloendopeptidase family protein [Microbacterium sp. cx-55]|uniref:M23 family metallopeptidase n=1 Tax=Microbacterium sp. cx-55 TaxID=2875948 RepID=UPI001CBF5664|nr:M23 family metallopeptidase [Microbacterium sp. cx-55]UGB34709.1 peptidoglycan DD-metalloendopeptidase family protein [Microbacterium sp. cx-55]
MTTENHQADAAPTRRSSRQQAAPAIVSETPDATNARRTRTAASRPATFWAQPRSAGASPADAPQPPAADFAVSASAVADDVRPTVSGAPTRKQLRERALRAAAAAAIADENPAVLAADAEAVPVEVARDAIDDAPAAESAPPMVAVAAPADLTAASPSAEILVPEVTAAEAEEAAFTEAVLVDDAEAHAIVDEFEAAARLFAFTGETPIQVAAAAIADEPAIEPAETAAPRRRRFSGASFKRATAASASVGVMGIVGLLAVGLTTPAEAVAAAGNDVAASSMSIASGTASSISDDEIQAYVAPADAQTTALDRSDQYSTASTAQLNAEIAAASGISHFSDYFTNDPKSAIQWPFPVGVSISYGFGMRSGTMHEGMDFTPGAGAQIQAVADGTVRIATESGGGYGVMVIIDHVIDGQLVSTRYGHMQYGSLRVKTGETVKVGQIIGLVGNTGHSFGAHLHFEVLQNGTTAIDPEPWLREHAGG